MKRAADRVRTFCIIAAVVFLTVFFSTMVVIVSLFGSPDQSIHKIARIWGRCILLISRIRVQVEGFSNIDPNKSYIFMANHQSNFDIPVLLAHLKVQFRWLAKAELFKIPVFGRAMRKAGYISIDRSDRKSAFLSLKRAAQTIRDGASVLIFPEGTRSRDGRISPFKKGGFVLATEAGVPIVPVILFGTWSIMSKEGLTIRPGSVVLQVLPPVETRNFSRKNKDALLEKIRDIMQNSFESDSWKDVACSN
ncbi:MAG: 1-acyl-sn-glycerol-3-phosphate acyltransferase [Desulfobacterales bacterium CG23_combo_of_CG06-09_8_20_14_all_52_9]|nr:MAG: 1-acyl-sn-glycerol-3-phosphate acyltransferase [Desulfobacterales bacterium CG23_combo_of_CG06-09_8_20_14_all_52_9]